MYIIGYKVTLELVKLEGRSISINKPLAGFSGFGLPG